MVENSECCSDSETQLPDTGLRQYYFSLPGYPLNRLKFIREREHRLCPSSTRLLGHRLDMGNRRPNRGTLLQ